MWGEGNFVVVQGRGGWGVWDFKGGWLRKFGRKVAVGSGGGYFGGWRVAGGWVKEREMKLPEMNGLKVLGVIGEGECGEVLAARGGDGVAKAVKVFKPMAVNRDLIGRMMARLEEGGWPEGVAVIESADLNGKPGCLVMPFYGKVDGDDVAGWEAESLQGRMEDHPGEGTWELVTAIGAALAEMHARRVAHGNLKPGNVFFGTDGGVKLTDWALGNMPGVEKPGFTDALLYQAPEQLVEPGGYFEEEGYGWDVFSFGVLSFRLLTGKFPRCDEIFSTVVPGADGRRRTGIHADAAKIARNLMRQEEVEWPGEAGTKLEGEYRELIGRCLEVGRSGRPGTMEGVMGGFAAIDARIGGEEEREALMDRGRRSERFGRRAMFVAGMAVAGCLVLAALGYLSRERLGRQRTEAVRERGQLDGRAGDAVAEMKAARRAAEVAAQELEYERERGLARLEESRLIGDRLFEWALEKGHRNLPALDGREVRLKRLERFYEDFLTRNAGVKSLEDERARVRLQLAEISLLEGDAENAERRLGEAIGSWEGGVPDGDTKLRLGRDALLLALLKQEKGGEGVGDAFLEARRALEDVPQSEVDTQRLEQLVAVLDFHEAKLFAARGEDGRALEQLMGATRKLNELADARPDSAVLRSELAACYLSSATILDGIGKMGDGREVRMLAVAELVALLKENPGDIDMRLELAGCYGALAEEAVLSGDVGSAEVASDEAMKLLDEVLVRRPDSTVATTRKAGQLGLKAGLLRDRGEQEEALAAFEEGIRILERQGPGGEGMVGYRLALLWWQKGRMLGFSGEKEKEIELMAKAWEGLKDLEAMGGKSGIRAEELQRSGAYLLGDYAHALELAEEGEKAKEIYGEAVELWEILVRSRPQSEEYIEGLEWIRQRAKGT